MQAAFGIHRRTHTKLQPPTRKNADKDDIFEDEEYGLEVYPLEKESPQRPWNLQDWLYPPHLPRSCQLLRKENIAIPACYLLVGLLMGLVGPLTHVYPLDLGATEAQQTTVSVIRRLPSSFKLIFGFISDNFPLFG
jgi:hypothetical protein